MEFSSVGKKNNTTEDLLEFHNRKGGGPLSPVLSLGFQKAQGPECSSLCAANVLGHMKCGLVQSMSWHKWHFVMHG